MGKLYFKIGADYEKVIKLREEIEKLKQTLLSMNRSKTPAAVSALEVQLGTARQKMDELVISAARAGAVMENDLKKGIFDGEKAVNSLSEEIIKQKNIIRETQNDVSVLVEQYKKLGKYDPKSQSLSSELNRTKTALKEQKYALGDLQSQQSLAKLSTKVLKDEYALFKDESKAVITVNKNVGTSFKEVLAAVGGTAMIHKFIGDVIKVRGQFQQLDVAFTTLLQSREKANALMGQMVETAAKTPFNLTELATGAKQLVAYGFASEGVNDTLIRLGNIAAGLGLPLERLTYLYGTTMTQGRLYARDLMQFTTSGIPMLQGLADMYGVSTDKVNEMVTAGKIGFPEVQKVIENLTNQGGKFFNLMEEQSQTITGKISNLGDSWAEMLNKIGQSQEGVINGSVDGLKYLVENYETVGKILTGLIGVYGTYRTAAMLVTAVHSLQAAGISALTTKEAIHYAWLVATKKAQLALNATMLTNPYVLLATAVVGTVAAIWAFHDSITAAEKAQSKFNDELDKFKQKEEERKQKIESLIRTIQDETETEFAKVKAYQELQRLSPALTDAYKREELAVASLADTNKELNKVRDVESYDNIIANIDKYSMYVKELQSISGGWSSSTKSTSHLQMEYPNTNVSNAREQAIEDLKKWQEALDEYKRLKKEAEENAKPVEVKLLEAKNNREQILQEFLSAKMTLEEEQRKIQESGFGVIPIDVQIRFDNAKAQLANIDKTIASLMQGKATQTYKEAYDTAKREWKAAQRALEESKKKSKADYDKAKKDLDDKEKNFKDLGGVTNTTKAESAAEKLRKQQESLRAQQEKYSLLMDKQTRDRVRAEEDAANEIRQAKIDADKDGAEKVLKQRELNHDKEIQAIAREADDRKRAVIDAGRSAFESAEDKAKAEDPKHVKKTFDEKKFVKSDDAIAEFLRINKVAQGKVDAENAKYNRGEDLKGLLDEYQDFADQRLAIEKKYNEDIKVLDAQRKTALENGDMEQVAKIDRSKVQAEKNKNEDLSGVSLEEFKTDIDWATLFGNLDVLSPESLNKLRDKLKAFIETAADKLKPEDLKVLSEAMTNVDLTIADKTPYEALKVGLSGYKVATGDAATAQEKLNKLQKDGKDGTQEYKDATKELTDAQRRRAESLKTVTQAANNIGSKGMEVVNAGNEIVGMLENFGVEVPEAVGKTLDGVGQVMSGLESLDLTKPFTAITGAISILSGIGNTIAGFLGFGKENKTLKDTQRLEETTNRLAETEKVINSFIEKRIELLKAANVEEQKNIAATTQTAIDNQKKYYESLMVLKVIGFWLRRERTTTSPWRIWE